jgi:hypothetical protein
MLLSVIDYQITQSSKYVWLYQQIIKKKTRRKTQLKIQKVMAVQVLTYRCKIWALNIADEGNTETVEIKLVKTCFWI